MKETNIAVVLGLGKSLALYGKEKRFIKKHITIGVNNIFDYYPTDYLIIIDRKCRFNKKRLSTIMQSRPKELLTFIDEYSDHPCFKKIELAPSRSNIKYIETKYCYSVMSPYVAIIHAYKLGCKNIILYGVDLTNHKELSPVLNQVKKDLVNLQQYLNLKGVKIYTRNNNSPLTDVIEYAPLDKLLFL